MVNFENKKRYDVSDLRQIISILRSPGGCPWDAEQTHESIRRNFLEEAYEAVEAIDTGDDALLREELGDVLMQVMFHADIAADTGRFNLDDVADATVKKLISRHPHVFGDTCVSGSDEVLTNWDALKRLEKKHDTTGAALDAVARSLPGLWRAEKLQKKAAATGFDWPDVDGALDKLREELHELEEAIKTGRNMAGELGDLLFSAVNVARFLRVDPEEAVHGTCERFIARYTRLEQTASDRGLRLEDMPPDALDALYEQVKSELENKYGA